MGALKQAHGGDLKNLYRTKSETDKERLLAKNYKSWNLTERQICDLDLLANGAFSPLSGFLGRDDYERVCSDMRLVDGNLWPIPITLDVTETFSAQIVIGEVIALRDPEGLLLATMTVEQVWTPDLMNEAEQVYGTTDDSHPTVAYLKYQSNPVYVGGKIFGVQPPVHYDFKLLRETPLELRERFRQLGWRNVVAFQTRNPLHRAHQELTLRAARQVDANLLIHPVVGLTKPGDIDHFTRVRCYKQVLEEYPAQTTHLSLLNLAMRMGGPREALLHAIIRKNYGCTHLIVGRDHAGPGNDKSGKPFYGPYDAQALYQEFEKELDIIMVPFQKMVYVENKAEYVPANDVAPTDTILDLSGAEFRRRLSEGLDIPAWFSQPSVVAELRKRYPPKHEQGFTVFFTGLSGAGKSTIANTLLVKLLEQGSRPVTLLDGDIARKNLSSELTFSKAHRDLNILRIGFVASEITKNGGIAICAPIAPYEATRRQVRELISSLGGYVEVYVSTPLEVCEQRDVKGLYAKARSGELRGFTGIDDPYEVPQKAEVIIDTTQLSPDLAADQIIVALEEFRYMQ